MAINLTPEANKLISDYMAREVLPSKSSAVNRLIVQCLSAQSTPPIAQPQAPIAQPAPVATGFSSQFNAL